MSRRASPGVRRHFLPPRRCRGTTSVLLAVPSLRWPILYRQTILRLQCRQRADAQPGRRPFLYSGCPGTPAAFPPFLLSKRGIHGQYNTTDCHHRRNPASRWWRLVWAGTLVLSHSLAPADAADSGFQLRSAHSDPQASICLTEALALAADSCPVTSIASSWWSLLILALGRQRNYTCTRLH